MISFCFLRRLAVQQSTLSLHVASLTQTSPSCGRLWLSSIKNSGSDNDDDDDLLAWIPPDRPISGSEASQSIANSSEHTVLREQLKSLERTLRGQKEQEGDIEEEDEAKIASNNDQIDWLQTRRTKLQGLDMMTPDMGESKKRGATDLPVVRHTLLSSTEIVSCLASMGGKDIVVIPDVDGRMGGAKGMILVSASTLLQVWTLADTLVRQLKRRDLKDVGVVGAQLGAEGSDDKNDPWRLVDCSNYIVQILEEETRIHLDLERLWGGSDPSRKVRLNSEEAMDAYVEANPVPRGYGAVREDWSAKISQMKRNRWIVPHKPVVSKAERKRMKRKRRDRDRRPR